MLAPYFEQCLLWHQQRAKATFKAAPSDFIVDEKLNWTFTGHGEHLFLYVEKINCNTVWVAKQLAKFYGVPPRDIGYSGLKDRHAVTRQYFSVRIPGIKPDSYALPSHDEYRVVSDVLHDKKLKRGNHACNDFTITLKNIEGNQSIIDERLAFIRAHGCPNLFDAQRFGHDNHNLTQLLRWVNGEIDVRKRPEKSLLLSAFRSALFNRYLAKRIQANTWNHLVPNDVVMLAGSNSYFIADVVDETLVQRAKAKDIHPAGMLVGYADTFPDIDPEASERLTKLMRQAHVQSGYRPLRLVVDALSWAYPSEATCVIKMRLPPGAYASGVIRQVFDIDS